MPGVKLIFGAGGIGTTEKSFTYTWDTPEKVSDLLDELKRLGFNQLDSAAAYPPFNPWNTETLLGQAEAAKKGFQIDSKILGMTKDNRPLSKENIDKSVKKTLELLGVSKIKLMYAHAPDGNTPLEETAAAFHEQYTAGKFEQLGLCNYDADALKKYLDICEKNGYVKPSVIQSQYNALARDVEEGVFPLLREHGMTFNAYSPLAGGFLTGKVTFSKDKTDPSYQPLPERTRWSGDSAFQPYQAAFDHDHTHAAIKKLRSVCAEHGIGLTDASLRWLVYHSPLRETDGIILGATRESQIQGNVEAIKKGKLPAPVAMAVDKLQKDAQGKYSMF